MIPLRSLAYSLLLGLLVVMASACDTPPPPGALALSGDLTFGNVQVGKTDTKTVTLTNTGKASVTVTSVNYPPAFSGDFSGGSISGGARKDVRVTFAPTSPGPASGKLIVESDLREGTSTMDVSGMGTSIVVDTRVISLSGTLTFGNVQVSKTATSTLTIGNNGTASLAVSSISYPAGFSGDFASGSIAAGEKRDVRVTFAPNAAINYTGTMTVNGNQTDGNNTMAVSGAGVIAPPPDTRVIALSGSLAFGNVKIGEVRSETLTIANTGNVALTVNSINYPAGFSGNFASGSIPAGGKQDVRVTFAPVAASNYGGSVTVNGNQTEGTNTIAASGAGINGSVSETRIIALSGNLAFPNVQLGKVATQTMTIANSGNTPLTITSISYPSAFSGDFTSGTIAAGGKQDVKVTFAPNAAINYGGALTVNGNHTSGTNTISVSGKGLPPTIVTNTPPIVGGTWKAEAPGIPFQWQMSATDYDGDEITWSAAPGHSCTFLKITSQEYKSQSKATAGGMAPVDFSGICEVKFQACDRHGACGQWVAGYEWHPAPPPAGKPAIITRNRFNLPEGRSVSGKLEASSTIGGHYGVVGDITLSWDSTTQTAGRTANVTVQVTNTTGCTLVNFSGFFYSPNTGLPFQELNSGASELGAGQTRRLSIALVALSNTITVVGFEPTGHFTNCR